MKMRITLGTALALAAVAAAVTVGAAGAATPAKGPAMPKVTATLDAAHVVPRPATSGAGAIGQFTAVLDGTILRYTFTFDHLSGQALGAQIRIGSPKTSGPIAQPLCVPCMAPETGVVPLYPAQLAALKAGRLYVVIETAADVDGEIRGQLVLGK